MSVTARLRALGSRELVALETDPRSPERGQYRFTQALLREVAYNTLAKRERRSRHLAAARYLEAVGDEELAGVLASHYTEAYRAAPEGEEGAAVAAQARIALRAAADRAARLFSNEQALTYYEQALTVTFESRDQAELQFLAATAALASGKLEHATELYELALSEARSSGDADRVADVVAGYAQALLISSRIDEALLLLEATLRDLPRGRGAVELNGHLARGLLFQGKAAAAVTAIDDALETAEREGMRATVTQLLISKGWGLAMLKRPREAQALLLGAMRFADEGDDLLARTRARFNLVGYMTLDDPRRALDLALEGIDLSRQYGLAVHAANMAGNAAAAAFVLGEFDQVLDLEGAAEDVDATMAATIKGYAAVVLALRGEWDAARDRIDFVDRITAATSSAQDQSWILTHEAYRLLARGELDGARAAALRGRDVYDGSDGPLAADLVMQIDSLRGDRDGLAAERPYLVEKFVMGAWSERLLRTGDAALAALDGRSEEARNLFRRVLNEWRGGGNKFDLAITLLARSRLLPGDEDATAARREAEEVFAALGASSLLETLDRTLGLSDPSARTPTETISQKGAAAATR